jgi:thiamine biosynthesis protein ThiC
MIIATKWDPFNITNSCDEEEYFVQNIRRNGSADALWRERSTRCMDKKESYKSYCKCDSKDYDSTKMSCVLCQISVIRRILKKLRTSRKSADNSRYGY